MSGDVEPLFALLLHAAPAHVLDQLRIDARPLHERLDDVGGQVLGTDVAEIPLSEDAGQPACERRR